MASFRRYMLPVIVIIIFLSRFLFFYEPERVTKKSEPLSFVTLLQNPASDFSSISREDTLKFSKNTSKITGIRVEFLVAIFSQESSLGKNVGSCYLFDPRIFGGGVGVDLSSGTFSSRIMKPERDVKPFMEIMKNLDRNPFFTAVSCPMKVGWGGAMGPAQILPSTWITVQKRTAIALNKKVVDPWIPEDAFMAAGIHLKDLGADHKKISSERSAACRYFSGKSCGKKNSAIAQYGDSVMKKTKYFEKILNPEKPIDTPIKTKPKHKAMQEKKNKHTEKRILKKVHKTRSVSKLMHQTNSVVKNSKTVPLSKIQKKRERK